MKCEVLERSVHSCPQLLMSILLNILPEYVFVGVDLPRNVHAVYDAAEPDERVIKRITLPFSQKKGYRMVLTSMLSIGRMSGLISSFATFR